MMKMTKFFIDESTGRKLFNLMTESGVDAEFAGDIMKGATDDEILNYCEKEKRIPETKLTITNWLMKFPKGTC